MRKAKLKNTAKLSICELHEPENGWDKNLHEYYDLNSLTQAVRCNSIKDIKEYINEGGDIHARYKEIGNILVYAAQLGMEDITKLLVEKYKLDVNVADDQGYTPLHYYVKADNILMVNYIIRHNANINAQDKDGFSSLHHAVRQRNNEMVRYLLKKNADVNVIDNSGLSPLHLAAFDQNVNVIGNLINAGSDFISQTALRCKKYKYNYMEPPISKISSKWIFDQFELEKLRTYNIRGKIQLCKAMEYLIKYKTVAKEIIESSLKNIIDEIEVCVVAELHNSANNGFQTKLIEFIKETQEYINFVFKTIERMPISINKLPLLVINENLEQLEQNIVNAIPLNESTFILKGHDEQHEGEISSPDNSMGEYDTPLIGMYEINLYEE